MQKPLYPIFSDLFHARGKYRVSRIAFDAF